MLHNMLKILIADDHEFIRKGLKQILIDEFSPVHIGEAEDTNKLLELASMEDWNIIYLIYPCREKEDLKHCQF